MKAPSVLRSVLAATVLAVLAACSPSAGPPAPVAPQAAQPASASGSAPVPAAQVQLDDTLWRVTSSSAVAEGTLYAFLADGTLVIGSTGGLPATGTWERAAAGGITMVEASRPYAVDVLEATQQRLRLRSHNPGTPVEITLGAAPAPPPVPQRFQGEWNAKLQDCGTAGNATRLRIGADSIRFHESSGALRAVLPGGEAELAIVASLSGEGQDRLAYRKYRLAQDGSSLADVTDGDPGGLVRRRCP